MASHKRRPVRALVTLTVAIVAACAALALGHFTKGVSPYPDLALDLKGGTQLILTPTVTAGGQREITDDDITQAISIIRNRIDASGVSESEISSMGNSNIMVSIPGTPSQEQLDLIRASSQMNFRPVLRMGLAQTNAPVQDTNAQSGDASATDAQSGEVTAQSGEDAQSGQAGAVASQSGQTELRSTAVDAAVAMSFADKDGDGVLSDTPAEQPENASSLQWKTEQVLYDFLTLDCSASADVKRVEGPADKPYAACDDSGRIKYILGPVTVPGSDLKSATAGLVRTQTGGSTGAWSVSLQFNNDGAEKFKESSEILYGFHDSDPEAGGNGGTGTPDRNHFAVVLDGTVITAPSMNSIIPTGQAEITGNFTAATSRTLANQLSFGSLPLNFEVESEQQISATIGTDHLTVGLWAAVIGFLLVILYLIWQYRGLAIISAGSLVVASIITYLVITLLSWWMGYRLSLAGVAGLIMAIGVTTDSFIVYFERVRDEVRDGRPLRAAVEEGWDRAKRTILVSDAVNLVAAVVLYLLAVGGVQGFAFTLGVTTVIDIAVIFLFTHPMMELLIRMRFFGEGHKFSGLDPEHLGAKNALVYAGRGRVIVRGESEAKATKDEAGDGLSIAERRRAARLAAQQASAAQEEEN